MPVYTHSARLIDLLVAAAKSEAIEAMSFKLQEVFDYLHAI
jgi:hypothetical protein